ncbi:MAG: hypothetical protein Q9160_003107 [Pyrenula sp. 1 TL-2023]
MSFGIRVDHLRDFGVIQDVPGGQTPPLANVPHDIFRITNFSPDSVSDFIANDVARQFRLVNNNRNPPDDQVRDTASRFWSPGGGGRYWSWTAVDFSRRNPMPTSDYLMIIPAVRLASHLLEHSIPFFARLEQGSIMSVPGRPTHIQAITQQQAIDPAIVNRVRQQLQNIAGRVHFFYGRDLGHMDANSDLFFSPFECHMRVRRERFLQGNHPFFVEIDRTLVRSVTANHRRLPNGESDINRIQLELGITLVHVCFPERFFFESRHLVSSNLS